MSVSKVSIHTSDGVTLAGHKFEPEKNAVGAALIVPAMGVRQRFYEPFAEWLASEGFLTLTFDYRGIGASRQGPLTKETATIVTWAERDTAAALDQLGDLAGSLPLTWIGHSLGGQIVPLAPNNARVAKIITVAAGNGYWRQNSPEMKHKAWFLWYGAVPIVTPLFGYFPGRRLGLVGDLPAGVIRQWRKWCLNPEYAVGVEGPAMRALFAGIKTPITALSFADDEMMSAQSIETIHNFYSSAHKIMRRIHPREVGLERIGHFGFFKPELGRSLWPSQVGCELARAV